MSPRPRRRSTGMYRMSRFLSNILLTSLIGLSQVGETVFSRLYFHRSRPVRRAGPTRTAGCPPAAAQINCEWQRARSSASSDATTASAKRSQSKGNPFPSSRNKLYAASLGLRPQKTTAPATSHLYFYFLALPIGPKIKDHQWLQWRENLKFWQWSRAPRSNLNHHAKSFNLQYILPNIY